MVPKLHRPLHRQLTTGSWMSALSFFGCLPDSGSTDTLSRRSEKLMRRLISACRLLVGAGCDRNDSAADRKQHEPGAAQVAADNTKRNERDQHGAEVTAGDQPETGADLSGAQHVSQAVVKQDALSINAKREDREREWRRHPPGTREVIDGKKRSRAQRSFDAECHSRRQSTRNHGDLHPSALGWMEQSNTE